MNINSAFPSKYLKAADAEEDLVLTIADVKIEIIGQAPKQEQKPVVYFTEETKGMVLNKTNAKMIAKIAKSDNTDDWRGIVVRIIATEVEFQGDLVMSLRVREVKKTKSQTNVNVAKFIEEPHDRIEGPDEGDIPFAVLLPLLLTLPMLGLLV